MHWRSNRFSGWFGVILVFCFVLNAMPDAFGNLIASTGSTPNAYLYRGERYDADLGLYYLRARWYNPVTGRFMTRDPNSGSIYDPASLHRYNYGRANPSNYIDPSGRASIAEAMLTDAMIFTGEAAAVTALGYAVRCAYYAEASALDLVGQHMNQDITQFGLLFQGCAAEITVKQFLQDTAANMLFMGAFSMLGRGIGWLLEDGEQGELLVGDVTEGFGNGLAPTQAGSLEEATAAQARAQELNSMRRAWESRNGTTAVTNVININTGEVQTWIATESDNVPSTWNGALQPNEVYIPGTGHAEQTIVNALGDDWQITSGGTSRNICIGACQPLLEGQDLTLGGPSFPGMSDKTPYRMFWSEQ